MRRRVVVTGLGCVCPVGNTVRDSWEALLHGRSGVATISQFDASRFPVRIAAEVKEFDRDFAAIRARYPKSGRNLLFAVAAGSQAVEDAGLLDARYEPHRIGIYTGAGEGGPDFSTFMDLVGRSLRNRECDLAIFSRLGLHELDPVFELEQEPSRVPGHLAAEFGFEGPNLNSLTACAAAAQGRACSCLRNTKPPDDGAQRSTLRSRVTVRRQTRTVSPISTRRDVALR